MAMVAMAVPVLPGKEQTWLDYTNRLQSTEFRGEYEASRRAVDHGRRGLDLPFDPLRDLSGPSGPCRDRRA